MRSCCCRPVGDQLGTDRQLIGDRLATVTWPYVYNNKKGLRLFRDQSATNWRLKTMWDCLQPLRLVGDLLPTSRRPVPDLLATTKNLSTIDLVAERIHLQQAKPPCDPPATSLRPLEIMLSRRSPTGCKLCDRGLMYYIPSDINNDEYCVYDLMYLCTYFMPLKLIHCHCHRQCRPNKIFAV